MRCHCSAAAVVVVVVVVAAADLSVMRLLRLACRPKNPVVSFQPVPPVPQASAAAAAVVKWIVDARSGMLHPPQKRCRSDLRFQTAIPEQQPQQQHIGHSLVGAASVEQNPPLLPVAVLFHRVALAAQLPVGSRAVQGQCQTAAARVLSMDTIPEPGQAAAIADAAVAAGTVPGHFAL